MQVIAYRANGSTSNIERVFLYKDSGATAGTEGDPITGLDHDSTGLIISSIANNAATAVANSVGGSDEIETIATLGTYAAPTSSFTRFREVDSTNHPGLYEIQFADTVYSVSSSKYTDICISGVADLATFHGRIYLDVIDAAAIRAALGMASANADTQWAALQTDLDTITADYATNADTSAITTQLGGWEAGTARPQVDVWEFVGIVYKGDGTSSDKLRSTLVT